MPKNKLTEYSATNASNTDVGGVNIDEGCLPSSVNNSIRELMTHLKNFSDGTDAIDALTVTGDLTVDTNTLHVDAANNRVGIGSASPSAILEVDAASNNFIRFADSGTLTGIVGIDDGGTLVTGATDGDMVLRAQTSGKGVVFGGNGGSRFGMFDADGIKFNSDTAAANALDDYEEGTWTPSAASANADASTTTTVNSATYTKIGNLVNVRCYISIDVTSVGSGAARITGLPFTNHGGYTPFTSTHETFAGSTGQGWVRPSNTVLEFLDANSISTKNISGTGTKYAMISATYKTDS